jgi:pimeloyl-ACP methyl ester carboxylesterase
MRRGARLAIFLLLVVAALLVVNTLILDSQTKSAEVTEEGGKIMRLSSVDLQVVDQPATGPPAGEGRPIVLLHCFACSSRWWDSVAPKLNESHRVIRIDLIGHGGSEKPKSGYEISAQGAAVAEALNKLGVEGATVVGHSMGGLVATAVAETASQLVDRVVLIASPSEPDAGDLGFVARLVNTPVIGQAAWRVRVDAMIKSGYADAFAPGYDIADGFENPDQVAEDSRAMTYTSFEDAQSESDNYLEEEPLAARLRTTGVPVLAIEGSEDQILDPDATAADVEAIPGARVRTIQGAGHSPNVEMPDETAKLILAFADAGGPAIDVSRRSAPPPVKGKPSGGRRAGGKP